MPPERQIEDKVRELMNDGCSFEKAFTDAWSEISDNAKRALNILDIKHEIELALKND